MCRNIRKLRRPDGSPTEEEMRDAALQFVRKVSGFQKPSQTNEAAFEQAIADITGAQKRLFERLVVRGAV